MEPLEPGSVPKRFGGTEQVRVGGRTVFLIFIGFLLIEASLCHNSDQLILEETLVSEQHNRRRRSRVSITILTKGSFLLIDLNGLTPD